MRKVSRYEQNGRNGSEGSGKGRFGGHPFGQVSAQVLELEPGLSAHALAAFLCLTIRAAEQVKTPLNEVRASPQDVASACRISRKSASTALEGLELAGLVELKESGEGKKARWKLNWHPAHIEAARKHAAKIIERRRIEWKKKHPVPQGAVKKLAHESR